MTLFALLTGCAVDVAVPLPDWDCLCCADGDYVACNVRTPLVVEAPDVTAACELAQEIECPPGHPTCFCECEEKGVQDDSPTPADS